MSGEHIVNSFSPNHKFNGYSNALEAEAERNMQRPEADLVRVPKAYAARDGA